LPTGRRSRREPGSQAGGVDDRANEALTNLSVYALRLDVEYHRLDARLHELANNEAAAAEVGAVLRERDDVEAQREAFRRALTALREQVVADPERRR
jgi:hypothetical protein